ncbi:hypothetical protein ACFLTU_08895, partial [Bacteroidota bacterium]
HVYNSSKPYANVTVYQVNVEIMDLAWKNNLMNHGNYIDFSFTPNEIREGIEPSMTLAGTCLKIFEPSEGSGLRDYSTDEYPEVLVDIRGRNRGTVKIPGASQLSGTIGLEMPTGENTGADFYSPVPPALN